MIIGSCNSMVIKIRKNRVGLVYAQYIAVLYTLIMSGSVYQYAYMEELGVVNIFVTMIAFLFYLLKNGVRITRIKKNISDIFVLCGGVGLLACMVFWREFAFGVEYLSKFSLILLPWLLCKYIEKNDFLNAFLKIIFIIALVSLIMFLFPMALNLLPFQTVIETSQWSFDNYLIYAAFHNPIYKVHQRNIGIFWEPGMFQGYLIFAMLYVAVSRKQEMKTVAYQIVMIATLITVQSSTGYLLLLPIALIKLMSSIPPERKIVRALVSMVVMMAVFVLIVNPQILYNAMDELIPGMTNKLKLDNSGGSMGTRFYGTLIDAYLVLKNPFGIGVSQINAYRNSVAELFGFVVDGANINTTFTMMLYYGWIPGIMYSILMVKGCFRYFGKNLIAVIALLVLLIIINTEPHYMTLFFTVVFMYFTQYSPEGDFSLNSSTIGNKRLFQ